MSRTTRPLRRVRGRARAQIVEALDVETEHGIVLTAWRLGCRPAQLRRCLLGHVVSARAAERILRLVVSRGEKKP